MPLPEDKILYFWALPSKQLLRENLLHTAWGMRNNCCACVEIQMPGTEEEVYILLITTEYGKMSIVAVIIWKRVKYLININNRSIFFSVRLILVNEEIGSWIQGWILMPWFYCSLQCFNNKWEDFFPRIFISILSRLVKVQIYLVTLVRHLMVIKPSSKRIWTFEGHN